MAVEIYIPKLGQTVEEVKIVQWMAEDGAEVKKGQEILEIETDKTTFVVEAEASGTLHRGAYAVGQTVPVLEVVATIGGKDEKLDKGTRGQGDKETPAESAEPSNAPLDHLVTVSPDHRVFASPRAHRLAEAKGIALAIAAIVPTGGEGVRIVEKDVLAYLASVASTEPQARPKAAGGGRATPLAQKLAAEAGIDLRTVTGTGPAGKITKEDVEAALAARRRGERERGREGADEQARLPSITPSPHLPPRAAGLSPSPLPEAEVAERIPLTGVRAIIAERLGTSVRMTARVTLVTEVDATEFVTLRERLKAGVSEEWGFALGYNDLLALVVAKALRKHPYMNARLTADAIELMAHVNLGMAVDTERGLLVPVIRDADTKSLRQFGAEFREVVERARKGRSLPDDLTGGTFTITNLGMHDIDAFTPVINLPEAAILGVGRISPKWVFRPESPDAPVLRRMLTLSLAFDHRLVDGAPAARFLQFIKGLIEEPYLLIAG